EGGTYGRDETSGNLQGSVSTGNNHTPGGSNCYLANGAAWGNPAGGLIVSSASVGSIASNATYVLSMYANGSATPVVLELLADGVEVTPTASVDPTLSGTHQEFFRFYDVGDLAGYVGQAMTIVAGLGRDADGAQSHFDDVSLEYFEYGVIEIDSDGDSRPDIDDNCPDDPNPGQEDGDSDGHGTVCDCDDGNPGAYAPGGGEVNDGLDNQCPGEGGYGQIDEIEYWDGLSWTAQSGATNYQVARSIAPDFPAGAVCFQIPVSEISDPTWPDPNVCLYYLVRALEPHAGSWGVDCTPAERTVSCP
ncbi:MAG: hypothetical protein GY722_01370, partial [bacterium]|nr:hypothetical protein [bacterium]